MKIVLDSNIVIADFWMESTNFKVLFENVKKGNVELFIPKIVIEEVLNKFQQRLNKSKTIIETELRKFNSLSKQNIKTSLEEKNITEPIENYEKHFNKVISENKITIIPYPKTEHKFLANKAMHKLKPFNSNEKGYRDCLIWENIKDLLTDEEIVTVLPELVFISNNYKDFAVKGSYILHSDLISELEEREFATDSVVIYPSLVEYNDKQGKLFFAQATTFEKKLKDGEFWDFDLTRITSEYLFENFVGSELYMYDVDIPQEFSDPTVKSINEDYEVKICSVKKFSTNKIIIDVEFEVETEIDLFIDKYEYYSLDDNNISIEDSDWNRHVMWASSMINVPLSMSVIVDTDLNLISTQINKVNKNYAQQYV